MVRNMLQIVCVSACIWGCASGQVTSERFTDRLGFDPYHEAEIANTSVSAPVRHFILARKGESICAVKFLKIWETPGKIVNEPGEGLTRVFDFFAEYEAYSAQIRSDLSLPDSWKRIDGSLSYNSIKPLSWSPFGAKGRRSIPCGPLHLVWYYPARLGFEDRQIGMVLDEELELAPTAWTSIEDIALGNPKLEWFKTQVWKDVKTRIVPMSTLPK